MGKRQKFIEGSFVEIMLNDKEKVVGRLFPIYNILVYDYKVDIGIAIDNFDEILKSKVITGNGIYLDVITKGLFNIIGFKELNEYDFKKFPITFLQTIGDYKDCQHIFINKEPNKVNPKDCIGLEASSAWEANGLVSLIKDYYLNVKNPYTELEKVILDENDIRYDNPFCRWDISKQKIVRFDPKTRETSD
jgi:hypothetical protein